MKRTFLVRIDDKSTLILYFYNDAGFITEIDKTHVNRTQLKINIELITAYT